MKKRRKGARSLTVPFYRNLVGMLLERDGDKCLACEEPFVLEDEHPMRPTIDHRVPKSLGGGSKPDNLQLLCGACNTAKGNSVALPLTKKSYNLPGFK